MAVTTKATEFGMHTEQLAGRSQQRFFRPEEAERFTYPQAFEVDFNKRAQFDAAEIGVSRLFLGLGRRQRRLGALLLCVEHEPLTLGCRLAELSRRQRRSFVLRQNEKVAATYGLLHAETLFDYEFSVHHGNAP